MSIKGENIKKVTLLQQLGKIKNLMLFSTNINEVKYITIQQNNDCVKQNHLPQAVKIYNREII